MSRVPVPPSTRIRILYLTLTAGCNLRCTYCYQNDKKARRMEWETARGAVDLLFSSTQPEVEIVFFGGEALLEFPLLEQTVLYAERTKPSGKELKFGLITNGTLLSDRVLDFVAGRRFGTLLSMDGIPAAQDLRGRGTFAVLDRLLDRIRRHHPGFLRTDLEIGSTVTPASIPHLAGSLRYFLEKRVRKVGLSPDFTVGSAWDDAWFGALEGQFEEIVELSLEHYARSGEVPFALFQGENAPPGDPWRYEAGTNGDAGRPRARAGGSLCGVVRGETPVVDVDGSMHGCASFLESTQAFGNPFLRETVASLRWGDFRSAEFGARYEAFPQAARSAGIFHGKARKRSSFGACGECRFLDACSICPTSIAHIPGSADPDRIPDFLCAFNLVSLAARERFLDGKRRIRPPARPIAVLAAGGGFR